MKTSTVLSLLASVLIPASLCADTINLTGSTVGGRTFTRPTETGARSFFSVSYNVYQFNVTTTGAFTFTLNAVDPSNYDTFLHIYVNAFDPADLSDPALNFFAANDDLNIANPNLGSGLTNITLTAGTNYYFVIDGFLGSDAGAYTASITGPGAINVIPEPSSTLLLGVALVGAGLLAVGRRFRAARA